MDEARKLAAMERAIAEARLSEPEDDRLHPRVGAVLTKPDGEIVLAAYRGQHRDGDHAEYTLFSQAQEMGLSTAGMALFVTLEPCTRRSVTKTPCAIHVTNSGVAKVYFGMLDPNPHIIGRGVAHLSGQGIAVEQFPTHLQAELRELNAEFVGSQAFLSDPIVSADLGGATAPRQRSGILATTLDMITAAEGTASIFSGDATWLKELFVGLLEAHLQGVGVRMLAQKHLAPDLIGAATDLGIEVGLLDSDLEVRGTICADQDGAPSMMLLVENRPARHALLFSSPHEDSVLRMFSQAFDQAWSRSRVVPSRTPELKDIPFSEVSTALTKSVPQYRDGNVQLEAVALDKVKCLTNDIEIFKLRRAASVGRVAARLGFEGCVHIAGTPWVFLPPIIERRTNGELVLIDGRHRLYHARQSGRSSLPAIVVSNISAPLPGRAIEAPPATIVAEKRDRNVRYLAYDPDHFRPIREALIGGPWVGRR